MKKYSTPSVKTYNFVNAPFSPFMNDGYSQQGEEGVIFEIFQRIGWGTLNKLCVEFGAWDGKHLSNTFALVESHDFEAVYIEGSDERFAALQRTCSEFPKITPIHAMVSREAGNVNSLDEILKRTGFEQDFDLLSIDIDTFDLDIWESLIHFKPKVVVIEINSGIMPGVLSRHNNLHDGNSFSSTLLVAVSKGYSLVSHTGNCIFVRNDLVPRLHMIQRYLHYPELLFRYEEMWFPNQTGIIRLVLRKLLPFKLKYLVMRGISLAKIRLINS